MESAHIVIFRTFGSYIDVNSYNCQELGLAKVLTRKGFRVSIVMGGPEHTCKRILVSDTSFVEVYYLKYLGKQTFCLFEGWKNLIERLKPDVLQIHDLEVSMTYLVYRYAHRKRIPCVLIQGACQKHRAKIKSLYQRAYNRIFSRELLKNIDAIGCKTPTAAEYLNEIYPCETSVASIGLDVERFQMEERRDWRAALKIGDKKMLLYIGRLENNGRLPLFLLDVLRLLSDEYCLVFAGTGPLTGQIERRAEEYGLSQSVFLTGRLSQTELPSLYRSADLFLLPSTYEIYGMVILEAMYFGVPVISTASAGAKAIIRHRQTGYIFEEFDARQWADAIRGTNASEWQAMGAAARQDVLERMTWEKTVSKFELLYENAVSRQKIRR